MIYSIVNNLLPALASLNFADRVAGISYTVELPIMSENNTTVLKRFPVIQNANKNQCDGNDYVSLVPDDSLKSLIYFDFISNNITDENESWQQFTAQVRLVAWFNLRNINDTITNCEQLLQLINNAIPFRPADFGDCYRITIDTTDKRIRDKSIFSSYTYSESEKQYLIYPFDFGHINLQISYRVDRCNSNVVIEPNTCNSLQAHPFATVYDGNAVVELNAGDSFTCNPCGDINIKNSDSSYDVDKNADFVLPDIDLTEWDGSVTIYPSVKDLSCKVPGNNFIYNFNGDLIYTLTPEQSLTINNCNVQNSDNSYNVDILAEDSLVLPDIVINNSDNSYSETAPSVKNKTITDITVTNPITGGTYAYPAKKNLTESVYKEISLFFKATNEDSQEFDITAKSAGTFANETLVNCTVVYEINNVVSTLPLTFADGNTYKATITRTNAALDASVTIYT